jgi:PAS domain S-box-containing protein
MDEVEYSREHIESRLRETEERFRLAQIASGIGWFEWDLATNEWQWTPYVAVLFGFDPETPKPSFSEWERAIFVDDVPKLHAAVQRAEQSGAYYIEFRVRHPDGSVHWIAGKGEARKGRNASAGWVSGVYYEISERKALEARLLALNETLEARIAELREEARTLEVLNRTGTALAAELSRERLVQTVTDAAVALTRAQFGAFFLQCRRRGRRGLHAVLAFRRAARSFCELPDAAQHARVRADLSWRGCGPIGRHPR